MWRIFLGFGGTGALIALLVFANLPGYMGICLNYHHSRMGKSP